MARDGQSPHGAASRAPRLQDYSASTVQSWCVAVRRRGSAVHHCAPWGRTRLACRERPTAECYIVVEYAAGLL
jgi:hypothetical protein